jgi:hypothetical protein
VFIDRHTLITHKHPPQGDQHSQFDQQHKGEFGNKIPVNGLHEMIYAQLFAIIYIATNADWLYVTGQFSI